MIKISGKTIDGKIVLSGVHDFCSTYGISLDDFYSSIRKEYAIDWIDFIKSARKHGQNDRNTYAKISSLIRDNDFLDKLDYVFKNLDR